MYRLQYVLLSILTLLCLPILYFQAKSIRKKVPILPEAKNPSGIAGSMMESKINMVFIGESTLAGVGVDEHKNGFAGSFATAWSEKFQECVTWRVYARSGYTAKRMNLKLLPKIEEKEIDVIVLGVGGNDAFTLNRPWKFKKEVCEIIDALQSSYPSCKILIPNVPPIKSFPAFTPLIKFTVGNLVELLSKELNLIADQYEEVFFNSEIFKLSDWKDQLPEGHTMEAFFSDGVHPSPLTYRLWANDFADFFVSLEK